MLEKEAAMPKDKRIDFVSIVTPNFVHFDPAMMALDKGFHVVIEKPITFSLEQAKQLKEKVAQTGLTL
jgi:predicted dehydrogenase